MARLLKGIQHKWFPPADPTTSFSGRTVIVTGASSGLGYEAALKFVKLGASTVILGVRNILKGQTACHKIESLTGSTKVVQVWRLDMCDYTSIKEFTKRAQIDLERLDVVVLNAGVFRAEYHESQYGWEEDLQVNTLSSALLAILLLPQLQNPTQNREGQQAPVVEYVSSGLHLKVSFTPEHRNAERLLESYNGPRNFQGRPQYGFSKLFAMYAMQRLASFTASDSEEPQVIFTSVCPGLCKSDLGRDFDNWFARIAKWLVYNIVGRSGEQGSRTLVSGTLVGEKGHGRFWQHDEIQPKAPLLTGEEGERLQEQVWHEVIDVLRRDVPEVLEIVGVR